MKGVIELQLSQIEGFRKDVEDQKLINDDLSENLKQTQFELQAAAESE